MLQTAVSDEIGCFLISEFQSGNASEKPRPLTGHQAAGSR
ncbi:hypothetical protein KR50_37100 [Jeotgalibacillus campisalis]|uniref:Uncharacterized protein n=1 Tax=Jeotgalibacillus campisalis TaxID=220754 RepID=A0A0C2V2M9_9BACL|nr:hypothetical protein KR50_37100 [Jeotgalibacillus campisalis]